eukprot:6743111-Prymnesium_polylepis.1
MRPILATRPHPGSLPRERLGGLSAVSRRRATSLTASPAGSRGTRWKLRAHGLSDLQVRPQCSPARPLYDAAQGQSARTHAAH